MIGPSDFDAYFALVVFAGILAYVNARVALERIIPDEEPRSDSRPANNGEFVPGAALRAARAAQQLAELVPAPPPRESELALRWAPRPCPRCGQPIPSGYRELRHHTRRACPSIRADSSGGVVTGALAKLLAIAILLLMIAFALRSIGINV